MKYPDDFINKVVCGDCIEIMKDIPDNSVDTVITDPPYALGFMGKAWDRFPTNIGAKKPFANQSKEQKLGGSAYQKWTEDWAKEALRVAKPGATLLCFGGTRTYHRLACAIEDAGWVIKDCLMFLYGSGFPKATDISKQLDKGHKRKVIGKKITPSGQKYPEGYDKNSEIFERANANITEPNTEEAKLWNGWKSHGLKPAYEPIIVAMKPNEGTYANNALKWGVAGLNIDGGRIPINKEKESDNRVGTDRVRGDKRGLNSTSIFGQSKEGVQMYKEGRFPANIILDEEAAKMLDEQSGKYKSIKSYRGKRPRSPAIVGDKNYIEDSKEPRGYNDIGGASRFFYVAKASKSERNMGCEGAYILKENTPEKIKKEIEKYLTTIKTDDILKE